MSRFLFIHGSGCTGEAFSGQSAEFGDSLAPNLPGHDAPGSPASIAEFADFIIGLCTQKTILAGNSLGGAIALEVALRNHANVQGIVLIGSGSRLKVAPAILEGLANDFETTAQKLATYMFADPSPERVAYAVGAMNLVGRDQTLRDYQVCNHFDVTERLQEISLPLLAITGESDVMTPPKYAEFLGGRVRGAQVRIIPGAGHLAMIEQPAATNAALRNFVQEVG